MPTVAWVFLGVAGGILLTVCCLLALIWWGWFKEG